ncbi:hypothetical protein SAMN04488005_0665 [Yoonia tamlensis]|uniref:YMGG-like Gly-zipper n=1 Tax=Yoonia tamlensis TaxID=390270 RepID=A0A1I6FX56_9RHOB|nr:hypothetical protein [Yoonia tamlensis]SFR34514.1 hypothetical protein SAMN04488005_0665 [Yoonia tamlensis]
MQKTSILLAAVAAFGLAGCIDNDAERGVVGAGAGLVAAEILGTDPLGTAAIGAAAGVFCDDAGVCR